MSASLVLLTATWVATIGADPQLTPAPLVPVPAATAVPPAPSTTPWQTSPTPHIYSEPEPEEEGGFFSRLRSHISGLFHRSSSAPSGCGCGGSNTNSMHPVPYPISNSAYPTSSSGSPTSALPKNGTSVVQTGYTSHPAVKPAVQGPALPKSTGRADEQIRPQYVGKIGHEDDYSWITGQLYHVPDNGGTWMVRYATTDTIDRYSGKLALAAPVKMNNSREGDLVNVRGQVLNAGAAVPALGCPLYRVQSIDTMERANP